MLRDWRIRVALYLVFTTVAIWYLSSLALDPSIRNSLRLGAAASPGETTLTVSRNLIEFDGLSREQVVSYRERLIAKSPHLVEHPYRISPAVFQIVGGLPWYGMRGLNARLYLSLHDERAMGGPSYGPSEEGRFILNPFMLVGVEISVNQGRKVAVSDQLLQAFDKLWLQPKALRWNARERTALVTLDLTQFLATAEQGFGTQLVASDDISLDLNFLNARDFGYEWGYPEFAQGSSVFVPPVFPKGPFPLRNFIHRGGSCMIAGGCNNGSPYTPEWYNYYIDALPAELPIRLWKTKPHSSDDTADFIFSIRFE